MQLKRSEKSQKSRQESTFFFCSEQLSSLTFRTHHIYTKQNTLQTTSLFFFKTTTKEAREKEEEERWRRSNCCSLDDAPSAARPLLRKVRNWETIFFFFLLVVDGQKSSFFLTTNFLLNRSSSDDSVISLSVSFCFTFMIKTHRCKNEATTNTDGGGSDAQQSDRGPVHRNLFRGREQQQQQQFVLEHGRPGGFTDAWIFVEEANEKRAKNEK